MSTNDHGSHTSGPNLPFQDRLARGETVNVSGTNVVRVPFGVRRSRRDRPPRAIRGRDDRTSRPSSRGAVEPPDAGDADEERSVCV